jgi:hypothetical protein
MCNGLDDDCNGLVDDGIDCGPLACHPVPEVCDGIDNDCNGTVDDGLGTITCGIGACQRRVQSCSNGFPQACVPGTPDEEVCNSIDDDCDGQVDEGCLTSPNFVFVTSADYSIEEIRSRGFGATTGELFARGADRICQTTATAASFPGTYLAWVSGSNGGASGRLPASARGWVRTDGRPFTDSMSGLTENGIVYYPIALDEHGASVNDSVWTGTSANGTGTATCQDWLSVTATGTGLVGATLGGTQSWTANFAACVGEHRLYCFGVDRNVAVSPTPVFGRRLFLTDATFTPGGGVAAADLLCATEAMQQSLGGEYRALLAVSGSSAASRFSFDGGRPWVRPDQVLLFDPFPSPSNAVAWSAPDVTASGVYGGSPTAWAGAADMFVAGTLASTCNNWMANDSLATATVGRPDLANAFFGSLAGVNCSIARRLYCLQE